MSSGTKGQFSCEDEKISSARKRYLPPFSAVRAFEAAARHLSFASAAEELCLSPSAVSHQIRSLEDYLATSLFHREGNRVTLSKTGRAYSGRLTELLDNLDRSTERVRSETSAKLRILSTPGFAARWLVPRLARFAHSQAIRLSIAGREPSTDFASNEADVVIQWRDFPTRGIAVWPFLSSSRYPVAAPGFALRENIQHPRDLLRVPLFQDEIDDMWPAWFQAAGVIGRIEGDGPTYPNCEYATTAAEAGLGVALGYGAIVRDMVAEGRLVKLFETTTVPSTIYAIACETGRQDEPLIKSLHEWLMNESKADGSYPEVVSPRSSEPHSAAFNA